MYKAKHLLAFLSLVLISGLLLSACASATPTPEPTQEETESLEPVVTEAVAETEEPTAVPEPVVTEEPKEEVTVEFWHCQDFWKPEVGVGWTMLQEFNAEHEGEVQVNLTWIPCSEYDVAMQTSIASKEMPDVFFNIGTLGALNLVNEGLIRPLDGIVPDDWADRFAEGAFVEGVTMVDGEIYSWPERGPWHRGLMFYNRDVLEKAGFGPDEYPQSWDELREMAKTISEAGNGEYFGVLFGGKDDGIQNLQTFAVAADPFMNGDWTERWNSYFDFKSGEYRFNSPAMHDAIQFWLDMDADGSILPGVLTMDKATARALWAEGKAAFIFEPQWVINITKRDYPDTDFGVANVPTPDGSPLSVTTAFAKPDYFVSALSENPEMAGLVVDQLLTRKEVFTTFIKNGIVLTANAEANAQTDLYPHDEFATYVNLSTETVMVPPVVSALNPDAEAAAALFHVSPSTQDKLKEIWSSGGTNLQQALDEYDEMLEAALDAAIEEAKAQGLNVSRDDYRFPNWDPTSNYTAENYAEVESLR